MKIFFLLIAITITNFLYPCQWMIDLVDAKQDESFRVLHNFDGLKYAKDANDLSELEAYWYTVGRTEALCEIQGNLHKRCNHNYHKIQ